MFTLNSFSLRKQQTHHHSHLVEFENDASPLVLYLNQLEDISFYDKFLLQFITYTAVRSFKKFHIRRKCTSTFIMVITLNIYVHICMKRGLQCSYSASLRLIALLNLLFNFFTFFLLLEDGGGGVLFFSYYSTQLIKLPSTGKTNKVHACIVYMNSTVSSSSSKHLNYVTVIFIGKFLKLNTFSVSQRFRFLLNINNISLLIASYNSIHTLKWKELYNMLQTYIEIAKTVKIQSMDFEDGPSVSRSIPSYVSKFLFSLAALLGSLRTFTHRTRMSKIKCTSGTDELNPLREPCTTMHLLQNVIKGIKTALMMLNIKWKTNF
uniref:Uncharacterized protein n=1 Tax=Glossina austeni TaxID=7395 RepID=A0A1A9UUM4_GLOAU